MEYKTEVHQPPVDNGPDIDIHITPDTLIMGGFIIWFLWDKVMKPQVVDKLDGVFAPVEEERRLTNILAQIGVVTQADRVVLAAFHNGALDSEGYHLQKMSTVNSYAAPGASIGEPIKDLPIGRVMNEVELLMKTDGWICAHRRDEELPQGCRDYLSRASVQVIYHRIVKVGNLPIGILSIQYNNEEAVCKLKPNHKEYDGLMEDLYQEISSTMKRRVIKPSWFKRFKHWIK